MDSPELFEILVRENSEMVRAYILASVRDPAAAEDLWQETFLTAWKNLDRYDRGLPFGPWVRGIATKLILNHRRKLGRSKVYYCDEQSLGLLDRSFEDFQSLHGNTFDEQLDALRDCMRGLTGDQRQTLAMHYENGLSCKEIAARIGQGLEAVKKHLQRGRMALMHCIKGKIGLATA